MKGYDIRSDIWSLGITMVIMIIIINIIIFIIIMVRLVYGSAPYLSSVS